MLHLWYIFFQMFMNINFALWLIFYVFNLFRLFQLPDFNTKREINYSWWIRIILTGFRLILFFSNQWITSYLKINFSDKLHFNQVSIHTYIIVTFVNINIFHFYWIWHGKIYISLYQIYSFTKIYFCYKIKYLFKINIVL